jgi:hypothetical protein
MATNLGRKREDEFYLDETGCILFSKK